MDNISTFRKMIVYEKPGDRFMVLLSAGNLSISQSVREILQVEQLKERDDSGEPITIWNARSMFDACRVLGQAVRHVYERDADALQKSADAQIDLFAAPTPQAEAEASAVDKALAAINPDMLSPKEALDALYRLKTLQESKT